MREILFRGKRVDNGEWVQGSLFAEGTRFEILRGTCNNVGIEGVDVIPDTIGQFTGKTVKSGNVFEGDIGKSIDGLFLVRWSEEKTAFVMNFYDYPYEELYLEEMWEDSEIIGNINDNIELLIRTPQNDEVRE